MLKDVVSQTEKGSRTYSYGYRDGYFKALDDVEQIVNDIEQQFVNGGEAKPKKFQSERVGVSVQSLVLPAPCLRGIDMRTMKALFQKLDEEVDEFKFEIMSHLSDLKDAPEDVQLVVTKDADSFRIAEEGADVCTVVTSLLEAIGIGFEMRQEAQRRVNKHNHERGRN